MKILYLTQYFLTPEQAGGSRHYYHVKHLISRGHQVDVITTYVQDHMSRTVPEKYRGKLFVKEYYENIPLYKTYAVGNYGISFFDRMKNYLSFMFCAILVGLRIKGSYNIVFTSSPPLFTGWAGYVLSKFKKALFVFEVRDLWPHSAIVLGFLKNPLLICLAEWLERFLYRKAAAVIGVTEGIAASVSRIKKPGDKVKLVTNGVDTELFLKNDFNRKLRTFYGLEGKFVVMYVGSHGVNNDLETIIEAADRLRKEIDVKFVFIGGGDHKPHLIELCKEKKLNNVLFIPPQPKATVVDFLYNADVCLLAIKKERFFQGTLPNKLFDYLASGKPIVAAVPTRGESAELIKSLQAGIVCPPQNGEEMADLILKLYQDREFYLAHFQKGQGYVFQNYSRYKLAADLEKILKTLLKEQKHG